VLGHGDRDHLGQRHRSALAALRWREHEPAAGQPFDLAADLDLTAQEVDHVDAEPERLPLPQPEAGAHRDERPMTVGQAVAHGVDGDVVPGVTSRVGQCGCLHRSGPARVGWEQTVLDGCAEDGGQPAEQQPDIAGLAGTGEATDPPLDRAGLDVAQLEVAERGDQVSAQP
jgi:hypothetical protein